MQESVTRWTGRCNAHQQGCLAFHVNHQFSPALTDLEAGQPRRGITGRVVVARCASGEAIFRSVRISDAQSTSAT